MRIRIPLSNPERNRVNTPAEYAPPLQLMSLVIGRLNARLQARIEEARHLEHRLMFTDAYRETPEWHRLERIEEEIERLKGAMGALRWACGQTAELDVGIDSTISIKEKALKNQTGQQVFRPTAEGALTLEQLGEARKFPTDNFWYIPVNEV